MRTFTRRHHPDRSDDSELTARTGSSGRDESADARRPHRTLGNQTIQRLRRSDPTASTGSHDIGFDGSDLSVADAGTSREREAERVADDVVRPRSLSASDESVSVREDGAPSAVSDVPTETRALVERAVETPGRPLSPRVGAFVKSRFGTDFGDVRLHTGEAAAEATQAMDAQAFTLGRDIVLGRRESSTETPEGLHLLAHELAHVDQGGRDDVIQRRPLGTASWDSMFCGEPPCRRVVFDFGETKTESEWRATLRNLDDEDEVRSVRGFLLLATDPSYTERTTHPLGFNNFVNNANAPPTDEEILQFMRALYSLGGDLDLPNHTFEAHQNGVTVQSFRKRVSELILSYQGRVLSELAQRNEHVTAENVKAVVEQGDDKRITMNMIYNAFATAYKGFDLIASSSPDESGRDQRTDAYGMIRNAGRTIRYVLEQHADDLAAREAAMTTAFDIVWSMVPGGGTLASGVKSMLAASAKEGIKAMNAAGDDPKKQADALATEFANAATLLIRQGTWSHEMENSLQIAVNSFESAWR